MDFVSAPLHFSGWPWLELPTASCEVPAQKENWHKQQFLSFFRPENIMLYLQTPEHPHPGLGQRVALDPFVAQEGGHPEEVSSSDPIGLRLPNQVLFFMVFFLSP